MATVDRTLAEDGTILPDTPDFDNYQVTHQIMSASVQGGTVIVDWSDGIRSRFHALWLRENAADHETINPETRESIYELARAPDDLHVVTAQVGPAGELIVDFAPEVHRASYHPGWLRSHDYSNLAAPEIEPEQILLWTGESRSEPPSFEGSDILSNDNLLEEWLTALARFGIARLRNVAVEPETVAHVARRIGTIRDSNFGAIFDVRARPDPDSNAYTSLALPPHTDLPTREYQPGLQFLHCLENSTSGGRAIYVDGFAVADHVRTIDKAAFEILATTPWTYTNRSRESDYRWRSPAVVLRPDGGYREVRIGDFLRGPLAVPFDDVEPAYQALKLFCRLAEEPRFQCRFAYAPGDLVGFDNRRVLHGREAFDAGGGSRWLQGCYGEREELYSRLRVLDRNHRHAALRNGQSAI